MSNYLNRICEANNIQLIKSNSVSGGDINSAYNINTSEGRLFIKVNSLTPFKEMFIKEAEGLKALQQAKLLKVPNVIAVGELEDQQYIMLEWLEKAQPSSNFWSTFAEGLASLHRITNSSFGWTSSNYIGSLVQQNISRLTWAEFYATQRILPLVKNLFDNSNLSKTDVDAAEKLCARLNEIFPNEPPALLHGDLWAGNFMVAKNDSSILSDAVPSIYDPAVYFGHREMDIGMTLLFGGFSCHFYDAYNSFYPLEKNWRERVSLTQLYPLLVHAILFRGGYINECRSILQDWK